MNGRRVSPLIVVTIFLSIACLLGMLADLRQKTWLYLIVYCILILIPLTVIEIYKKRTFGNSACSLVVAVAGIGLAFAIGNFQSKRASEFLMHLRSDAIAFHSKEGRFPSLQELASRNGETETSIRYHVAGVRLSYISGTSRGLCLRTYQFPSAWIQTCLDTEGVERLKDDL